MISNELILAGKLQKKKLQKKKPEKKFIHTRRYFECFFLQEVLKALTQFHYQEIERYKVEIKKSKRPRISETPNTSTKNCTPTESARSAPAENNDATVKHVK